MTAFLWSVIAVLAIQSLGLLLMKPGEHIVLSERVIRFRLILRLALIGWAAFLVWSAR